EHGSRQHLELLHLEARLPGQAVVAAPGPENLAPQPRLGALASLELLHQLLHGLGAVARYDEHRIAGFHDDAALQSDHTHQAALGTDVGVTAVHRHDIADERVAAGIALAHIEQCRPRAD